MPRSALPFALLTLTCAAAIAAYGLLSPINNWDLIGYIASALSNTGLTGPALHDATYATLQAALPPERFDLLTSNGAYARGVYQDPEALEQHLPFYRTRLLYILALQAIATLTPSLVEATYILSAGAAAALTLLGGVHLQKQTQGQPIYVTGPALIIILYISSVSLVARLSTPDALFSLAAFAALALFARARTASLIIIALLPLIRTDAIVLSALMLVLLLAGRDRNPWHYAALAISATLYFGLNAAYGNYGHLVLFNFSLIPGQRTPYPEALEIVRDPGAYLEVYKRSIAGMWTRWVTIILLAAGAGVALERARTGKVSLEARLALICIGYVLLHFLAFPLGVARHYSFAMLFCCIYVTRLLAVTEAMPRT